MKQVVEMIKGTLAHMYILTGDSFGRDDDLVDE